MRQFLERLSPQQHLFIGFLTYIGLGALLLLLPISQKNTVGFTDAVFMSASAVSTTGLATVSTYDNFNLFGQAVIMLLIQIGGIGYMSFSSFVIMAGGQQLHGWRQRLLNAEFNLPKGFIIKDFIKAVIIYTVGIEILGALGLFIALQCGGYEMDNWAVCWFSIFHSVSAFCTAGFGLYNDSFEQFKHDIPINSILSILSVLGALGFIVATDIYYKMVRVGHKITLTTKIIVTVFGSLTAAGTIFLFAFEPSIAHEAIFYRWMIAFFQTMSALSTVGFNSIPIGGLATPSLLIIIFLMYVGASPVGTGGGLKSTTLTAGAAAVWSRIRGSLNVFFGGKQIPAERVSVATSAIILYTFFLSVGCFGLVCLQPSLKMEQLLFEAASALGTVGLSTGITGALDAGSKWVLIALMYIGRLGVLTFGLALLQQPQQKTEPIAEEADVVL